MTNNNASVASVDQGPKLGQLLPESEKRRDAIHIAVAPVTAATRLSPGQHVGLVEAGSTEMVGPCDNPIGIVDPFLAEGVEQHQRCWLFLYPNTITGLRHVWSHAAFAAANAAFLERASPAKTKGQGEY